MQTVTLTHCTITSCLSDLDGDNKEAFEEMNNLTKSIKVNFNDLRRKLQEYVSANCTK